MRNHPLEYLFILGTVRSENETYENMQTVIQKENANMRKRKQRKTQRKPSVVDAFNIDE